MADLILDLDSIHILLCASGRPIYKLFGGQLPYTIIKILDPLSEST